jgi:hypothetical protein
MTQPAVPPFKPIPAFFYVEEVEEKLERAG